MPEDRDHYKVLGVPPIAKREEIKKAYKEKAKKYHPDLNPNSREFAEEKMKEIVSAYDTLMDNGKRNTYNNSRFFALRTPPQLRRGKSKSNQFDKELSRISRHNFSLLDKIKGFFSRSKEKPETKGLSKDMADHFAMGITYSANNDKSMLEMARDEFKIVQKAHPESIYTLYNIAMIDYRLGEFDEALVKFKKIITIKSDFYFAGKMASLLRND